MENNTVYYTEIWTRASPGSVGWQAVPGNTIAYFVQGCMMVLFNTLIAATIARTPKLWLKEYYVVAALAVADATIGLGFASAGLWRSVLLYRGVAQHRISVAACYLVPHATLFVIAVPLTAMMMVCVSVDRLIAVSFPFHYYAFDGRYSAMLIGAFAGGSLLSSAAMAVGAFANGALVVTTPAICGGAATVHTAAAVQYYYGVRSFGGWGSVLLYLLVPVAYRYNRRATTNCNQKAQEQAMRAQHQMMVTIGLLTGCTFIFHVVPSWYHLVIADATSVAAHKFIEYAAVIQNINCLCNIGFYFKRHTDIRHGILRMFGCAPRQTTIVSVSQHPQAAAEHDG